MARRGGILLIGGGVAAASLLAGCASNGLSDAQPVAAATASAAGSASGTAAGGGSADPGCTAALHDVSQYGPSTVKLLADGREAVAKAAVQLLVYGLDSAADAASTPQARQAIETLANAYVDYFDLTTDAVAIPLSTLLKDTTDLEFVCR
jgi:hypothetical protein